MRRRDTGPSAKVRREVAERAGHRCERCRCHPWPQGHVHHRKPRGIGGTVDPRANLASNLAYLCSTCHDHVELNRAESYAAGWLLTDYEETADA